MSGCHALKHYISFLASYFTDYQVVRILPERFAQQLKHGYLADSCACEARSCHARYPVFMRQGKFARILNADDFGLGRDEKGYAVQQGSLSCRDAPCYQYVDAIFNK